MPTLVDEQQKVLVYMSPGTMEKLDELARAIYRGVKRPQAVRWLIEDAYQRYKEEVVK